MAIDIAARSAADHGVAPRVTGAIRQAARATGASFDYLLTTAQLESNLNPDAQATTSSATGLFQFIDQTWLGTMKQAGPALGYGNYADAITQDAVGPLRGRRSGDAQRDHARCARIRRANADDGGRVHAAPMPRCSTDATRPQADARASSTSRISSAPDGAAQLIAPRRSSRSANAAATCFRRRRAPIRSIFYDKPGRRAARRSLCRPPPSMRKLTRAAPPMVADATAARRRARSRRRRAAHDAARPRARYRGVARLCGARRRRDRRRRLPDSAAAVPVDVHRPRAAGAVSRTVARSLWTPAKAASRGTDRSRRRAARPVHATRAPDAPQARSAAAVRSRAAAQSSLISTHQRFMVNALLSLVGLGSARCRAVWRGSCRSVG